MRSTSGESGCILDRLGMRHIDLKISRYLRAAKSNRLDILNVLYKRLMESFYNIQRLDSPLAFPQAPHKRVPDNLFLLIPISTADPDIGPPPSRI